MLIASTFVSNTSFTVVGDHTGAFAVGVRVQADCGTDGTVYGTVTTSSYASGTDSTTVTLSLDSGSLTANLTGVLHGNDIPASLVNHGHTSQADGGNIFATSAQAVTGTSTTLANTPASARQAMLSLLRDSLGKFPGVTPPSLNLFCGDATSDAAPAGTFTRSTTGTRLGQAGLIETAAAGSVRREWGVGGALYGWRIEESRTNLITYSEQFDNAAWGKYNTTVSANGGMAPDGNTTADKIIESSASSTHVVYKTVATTLSSVHTFCVFVKKSERSRFMLYMFNNGSQSNYIRGNFDLEAQTFSMSASGNGSVIQANLSDIGDGWYLASITGAPDTSIGSGIAYLQIRLLATSGNENYQGDGTSGLYAWGIQLESGPFPTSYISTTSSAVARSADVWTVPLAASWFNTTAGTAFVAGRTALGAPATGAVQVLAQYDDGSANNRIRVARDENRILRCVVTTAGTEVVNLNLGTVADATAFRVAFSWSSSGFSASLNGETCVTTTAATLPSGLTAHRIGSDAAGGSQWGGHISHDVYFPAALSDAQLQAITL